MESEDSRVEREIRETRESQVAPEGRTAPESRTARRDTGAPRPDPVLAQALAWLDEGRRVALATVTRTWGSSPRRAGSHMAISDDGDFAGSVSGGCIEGAVIETALEVMRSGRPRTLEFGVTNEMAWEVGLACGGRIHLFVEAVTA